MAEITENSSLGVIFELFVARMPAEILGEIEQRQSTEIHGLRADLFFTECHFWGFYLEGHSSVNFGRIDTKIARKQQALRLFRCANVDRKWLRCG